jgi:hypothetical protein
MFELLTIIVLIVTTRVALDISDSMFYRRKFIELINRDRDKALNLVSTALAKELAKRYESTT